MPVFITARVKPRAIASFFNKYLELLSWARVYLLKSVYPTQFYVSKFRVFTTKHIYFIYWKRAYVSILEYGTQKPRGKLPIYNRTAIHLRSYYNDVHKIKYL